MTGIQTLAIIKPDAVANGNAAEIFSRARAEGFHIRHQARIRLSVREVDALYREHEQRHFYAAMRDFMVSGDVYIIVLERADAVATWRAIMGATDSRKAENGTLRCSYGDTRWDAPMFRNAVHGSATDADAGREIALFFGISTQLSVSRYAAERAEVLAHNAADNAEVDAEYHRFLCFEEVRVELARGRSKHPTGRFLYASLLEEVGELALAIIERKPVDIRTEAIQVACVALRIAQDGDPTKYHPVGVLSLGYHVGQVARNLLQRSAGNAVFALGSLRAMTQQMNARHDESKLLDATFDDLTDEEANP